MLARLQVSCRASMTKFGRLNTSTLTMTAVFCDFKQTWKRRLAMADGVRMDSVDGGVEPVEWDLLRRRLGS